MQKRASLTVAILVGQETDRGNVVTGSLLVSVVASSSTGFDLTGLPDLIERSMQEQVFILGLTVGRLSEAAPTGADLLQLLKYAGCN